MKKYWKYIVGIIVVGIIVLLGSFSLKKTRLDSDMINFLMMIATFLAVVVALFSTYRTNKHQQESEFKKSRPYFILKVKKGKVLGNNPEDKRNRILYSSLDAESSKYEDLKNKVQKAYDPSACDHLESIQFLSLYNVSQKSMMALQINVWFNEPKSVEIYKIDLLPKHTELELFSKIFLKGSILKKIKKIDVYFTTELRERVKLVFDIKDGTLHYEPSEKILENKVRDKVRDFDTTDPNTADPNKVGYNVDDFQETAQLFIKPYEEKKTATQQDGNATATVDGFGTTSAKIDGSGNATATVDGFGTASAKIDGSGNATATTDESGTASAKIDSSGTAIATIDEFGTVTATAKINATANGTAKLQEDAN